MQSLSGDGAGDTIQLWTMPVGLFLGGALADRAFEPLMAQASRLQSALTAIVGRDPGSGIALQILLTACATIVVAVFALPDKRYRALDDDTQAL